MERKAERSGEKGEDLERGREEVGEKLKKREAGAIFFTYGTHKRPVYGNNSIFTCRSLKESVCKKQLL